MTSSRRAHLLTWPWRSRLLVALAALVVVLAAAGWLLRPRAPAISLVATLGPSDGSATAWPLAFSPDGSILAVERNSAGIELWDVGTRTLRRVLPLPDPCHEAGFSPDGLRLAAASYYRGMPPRQTVAVFDVATGEERYRFEGEGPVVYDLRFDDDGTTLHLLTSDDRVTLKNTYQVWTLDTATRKPLPSRPLPIQQLNFSTISPDFRTLATSNYTGLAVNVWDLTSDPPSGTPLTLPSTRAGVLSLKISPDGTTLAVGQTDGSIALWDVAKRRLRTTLHPHSRDFAPLMVVFSDGRTAASVGQFGWSSTLSARMSAIFQWIGLMGRQKGPLTQVAVWDVETGRVLGVVDGPARPVLTADGQFMATTYERGAIRLWHLAGESSRKRTSARP